MGTGADYGGNCSSARGRRPSHATAAMRFPRVPGKQLGGVRATATASASCCPLHPAGPPSEDRGVLKPAPARAPRRRVPASRPKDGRDPIAGAHAPRGARSRDKRANRSLEANRRDSLRLAQAARSSSPSRTRRISPYSIPAAEPGATPLEGRHHLARGSMIQPIPQGSVPGPPSTRLIRWTVSPQSPAASAAVPPQVWGTEVICGP